MDTRKIAAAPAGPSPAPVGDTVGRAIKIILQQTTCPYVLGGCADPPVCFCERDAGRFVTALDNAGLLAPQSPNAEAPREDWKISFDALKPVYDGDKARHAETLAVSPAVPEQRGGDARKAAELCALYVVSLFEDKRAETVAQIINRFAELIVLHYAPPLPPDALAVLREAREALEELAKLGEQGMEPDYNKWLTFHDAVANVARVLLTRIDAILGKVEK